jgi:hypothetical protein
MSAEIQKGRDKFPIWNSYTRKFINHYKQEELTNVLNLIDITHNQLVERAGDPFVRVPELKIARIITKLRNPPQPVLTWMLRVIRIYYYKPLLEAVRDSTISARYALSDLANRVGDRRFTALIEKACEGNLTNAEFRRQSVKLNKD